MHYLHAEAPVKVIHRDLKSRNGSFLQPRWFIVKTSLCVRTSVSIFTSWLLSRSCHDSRQSPEGLCLHSNVQFRKSEFQHWVGVGVCVWGDLILSFHYYCHCWDFRFVTSERLSSSLTPLTWRWWERSPGWPPKSSRVCPSQRPATPTPTAWWAHKPYHNTTMVNGA